jgi:hypothetical protein
MIEMARKHDIKQTSKLEVGSKKFVASQGIKGDFWVYNLRYVDAKQPVYTLRIRHFGRIKTKLIEAMGEYFLRNFNKPENLEGLAEDMKSAVYAQAVRFSEKYPRVKF